MFIPCNITGAILPVGPFCELTGLSTSFHNRLDLKLSLALVGRAVPLSVASERHSIIADFVNSSANHSGLNPAAWDPAANTINLHTQFRHRHSVFVPAIFPLCGEPIVTVDSSFTVDCSDDFRLLWSTTHDHPSRRRTVPRRGARGRPEGGSGQPTTALITSAAEDAEAMRCPESGKEATKRQGLVEVSSSKNVTHKNFKVED
ncbi:hypothetical protein J6590_025077 [Homalodisca vitripennis]|nr:hypothetical protein J6590_025077 [Homalodisca vitripennis]